MSWTPSRGRPHTLPVDRTPLRGRHVDGKARVAWLLRTQRIAGRQGPAAEFTDALAEFGVVVNPTALSRYETGTERVRPCLIRAYEQVMGLPAGQLLGVSLGIHTTFGSSLNLATPPALSRTALSQAVGDVERRIHSGTLDGVGWLRAGEFAVCPEGPFLPPSVARIWIDTLVGETMRSVGRAYTTRRHALSVLLTEPELRPMVVEAVEDAVSAPGAQGVVEVMAVLGTVPDRDAIGRLLRWYAECDGARAWGAAHGLLLPVVGGMLPADLLPELTGAILEAAFDQGTRGRTAFMLAQRLSPDLLRQVVHHHGGYPEQLRCTSRVDSPAGLRDYLAAAVQCSGLDDRMLDRLLREALSPDFVERRHLALLLISSSPYRDVIADTALRMIGDGDDLCRQHAALTCLTYLARPEQHDEMVEALASTQTPGTVLVALAHSGGVPPGVDLYRRALDPAQAAAAVYAAGMSGHPDLGHLADAEELAGTTTRLRARWWRDAGAAVTDGPVS